MAGRQLFGSCEAVALKVRAETVVLRLRLALMQDSDF